MIVKELKVLLENLDDNLLVVAKPSIAVGDTGGIHSVYVNESNQFGKVVKAVVLSGTPDNHKVK
jgi:hypothetical protein